MTLKFGSEENFSFLSCSASVVLLTLTYVVVRAPILWIRDSVRDKMTVLVSMLMNCILIGWVSVATSQQGWVTCWETRTLVVPRMTTKIILIFTFFPAYSRHSSDFISCHQNWWSFSSWKDVLFPKTSSLKLFPFFHSWVDEMLLSAQHILFFAPVTITTMRWFL